MQSKSKPVGRNKHKNLHQVVTKAICFVYRLGLLLLQLLSTARARTPTDPKLIVSIKILSPRAIRRQSEGRGQWVEMKQFVFFHVSSASVLLFFLLLPRLSCSFVFLLPFSGRVFPARVK